MYLTVDSLTYNNNVITGLNNINIRKVNHADMIKCI